MLKMLVVSESKTGEQGAKLVKISKKINASRIPPNQWKRLSCKHRFSKLTWMLKKLVVWGWKQQWERTNRGQNLHENQCVQNSTKSIEKVKSPTKIMKITLVVENADGLGLKTTMKKDKHGAKFTWKLMCQEFQQVNRKGQVTNRDYEN